MKKFLLLLITIYQTIISSVLKNVLGVNKFCKFSPTCSEYAKEMIKKYGVVAGILLGVKRIGACR